MHVSNERIVLSLSGEGRGIALVAGCDYLCSLSRSL
jgi:hypothetical protein